MRKPLLHCHSWNNSIQWYESQNYVCVRKKSAHCCFSTSFFLSRLSFLIALWSSLSWVWCSRCLEHDLLLTSAGNNSFLWWEWMPFVRSAYGLLGILSSALFVRSWSIFSVFLRIPSLSSFGGASDAYMEISGRPSFASSSSRGHSGCLEILDPLATAKS